MSGPIYRVVGDHHEEIVGDERDALLAQAEQAAAEHAVSVLRSERNARLAASDWTGLTDAPLTEAKRKAWAKYRQALRDLPDATSDPNEVVWPEPPK